MKINTTKQNRDVHNVTVDQDIAHRIIAERVAEKIGINLDHHGVTWRAYNSTRDTSTGIFSDVVVEIVDDHTNKPAATTIPDPQPLRRGS